MTQFRPFSVAVRQANGAAIIDLHGEINTAAEAALNGAYAEAMQTQPGRLLLNFGDVDYINSTGIALIVGVLAQARKAHIALVTYGLSPHYQEIFKITRLSDFMGMVSDEASALAGA
ncbi:MAG TPA: STAS domain-containing protein [Anaerolineae bacterium]|nr:STAS domain-containing protein [Anaerolineae bacterium]